MTFPPAPHSPSQNEGARVAICLKPPFQGPGVIQGTITSTEGRQLTATRLTIQGYAKPGTLAIMSIDNDLWVIPFSSIQSITFRESP